MHHKPIEQQVVALSGTASGIGRLTALRFAEQGAKVVAADNDQQGLDSLVREIRGRGGEVTPVVADVTDFEQVQAVADTAAERYGRLDTWVGIAGISVYSTFMDMTMEEFKRVVEVDLMGQVHGARAALPHLIRSSGGLIEISSVIARVGVPYQSAYSAAKHGIDGFLEALRLELKHAGIPVTVTQIMPSSIDTPFFTKAATRLGVEPMAFPPMYAPETVAQTILHAAVHPKRDIIVGGAGKQLVTAHRLSPHLVDALMLRFGFAAQRSGRPKSAAAPNEVFGPAGTANQIHGDSPGITFKHSLSTWLDLHPGVKATLAVGTAVGLGTVLARRNSETTSRTA